MDPRSKELLCFLQNESKTDKTSKGFVLTAADILQSIDQAIDPCQDFYSYACNGWIQKHPIPKVKILSLIENRVIQLFYIHLSQHAEWDLNKIEATFNQIFAG